MKSATGKWRHVHVHPAADKTARDYQHLIKHDRVEDGVEHLGAAARQEMNVNGTRRAAALGKIVRHFKEAVMTAGLAHEWDEQIRDAAQKSLEQAVRGDAVDYHGNEEEDAEFSAELLLATTRTMEQATLGQFPQCAPASGCGDHCEMSVRDANDACHSWLHTLDGSIEASVGEQAKSRCTDGITKAHGSCDAAERASCLEPSAVGFHALGIPRPDDNADDAPQHAAVVVQHSSSSAAQRALLSSQVVASSTSSSLGAAPTHEKPAPAPGMSIVGPRKYTLFSSICRPEGLGQQDVFDTLCPPELVAKGWKNGHAKPDTWAQKVLLEDRTPGFKCILPRFTKPLEMTTTKLDVSCGERLSGVTMRERRPMYFLTFTAESKIAGQFDGGWSYKKSHVVHVVNGPDETPAGNDDKEKKYSHSDYKAVSYTGELFMDDLTLSPAAAALVPWKFANPKVAQLRVRYEGPREHVAATYVGGYADINFWLDFGGGKSNNERRFNLRVVAKNVTYPWAGGALMASGSMIEIFPGGEKITHEHAIITVYPGAVREETRAASLRTFGKLTNITACDSPACAAALKFTDVAFSADITGGADFGWSWEGHMARWNTGGEEASSANESRYSAKMNGASRESTEISEESKSADVIEYAPVKDGGDGGEVVLRLVVHAGDDEDTYGTCKSAQGTLSVNAGLMFPGGGNPPRPELPGSALTLAAWAGVGAGCGDGFGDDDIRLAAMATAWQPFQDYPGVFEQIVILANLTRSSPDVGDAFEVNKVNVAGVLRAQVDMTRDAFGMPPLGGWGAVELPFYVTKGAYRRAATGGLKLQASVDITLGDVNRPYLTLTGPVQGGVVLARPTDRPTDRPTNHPCHNG